MQKEPGLGVAFTLAESCTTAGTAAHWRRLRSTRKPGWPVGAETRLAERLGLLVASTGRREEPIVRKRESRAGRGGEGKGQGEHDATKTSLAWKRKAGK